MAILLPAQQSLMIIYQLTLSKVNVNRFFTVQEGDFNASFIGNDITNLESMRWNLKTQFDRDVVTHFEAQV